MPGSQITPHGGRIDQILSGMGMDFVQEFPKEGEIAVAPAKDGDPCFAKIHVGDTVDEVGPCPYPMRDAVLPKTGDRCLLVYSNFGQPWIVAWWPYA